MKAEPYNGEADGPDMMIDRADDGTPLTDNRGWTCGGCDTLYARVETAAACCGGPRLALFDADQPEWGYLAGY